MFKSGAGVVLGVVWVIGRSFGVRCLIGQDRGCALAGKQARQLANSLVLLRVLLGRLVGCGVFNAHKPGPVFATRNGFEWATGQLCGCALSKIGQKSKIVCFRPLMSLLGLRF